MTQRTLAIIKPDAVAKAAVGAILAKIEQAGFKVLAAKLIRMSFDDAAGFYAVHRQRPFFKSLCTFMTQGPCIPLVLEADNAIQKWRDLMGAPPPWPDDLSIKPLAEPLKAWPADVARIGLMHRFGRLLPAMSNANAHAERWLRTDVADRAGREAAGFVFGVACGVGWLRVLWTAPAAGAGRHVDVHRLQEQDVV